MKRFVTIRTMILGLTLLLGTLPVSAAERPIALFHSDDCVLL
jgi:hypothetical protein